MARSIQRHFAGHVTRTPLFAILLPLSLASLFGSLNIAARLFPTRFDWRVCLISKLTWQAFPFVSWQFNRWGSLQAGYRWVYTDYETGTGVARSAMTLSREARSWP